MLTCRYAGAISHDMHDMLPTYSPSTIAYHCVGRLHEGDVPALPRRPGQEGGPRGRPGQAEGMHLTEDPGSRTSQEGDHGRE